jgi:hypothetical protein
MQRTLRIETGGVCVEAKGRCGRWADILGTICWLDFAIFLPFFRICPPTVSAELRPHNRTHTHQMRQRRRLSWTQRLAHGVARADFTSLLSAAASRWRRASTAAKPLQRPLRRPLPPCRYYRCCFHPHRPSTRSGAATLTVAVNRLTRLGARHDSQFLMGFRRSPVPKKKKMDIRGGTRERRRTRAGERFLFLGCTPGGGLSSGRVVMGKQDFELKNFT